MLAKTSTLGEECGGQRGVTDGGGDSETQARLGRLFWETKENAKPKAHHSLSIVVRVRSHEGVHEATKEFTKPRIQNAGGASGVGLWAAAGLRGQVTSVCARSHEGHEVPRSGTTARHGPPRVVLGKRPRGTLKRNSFGNPSTKTTPNHVLAKSRGREVPPRERVGWWWRSRACPRADQP